MPALMCYERSSNIGDGIGSGVTVVAFSPDGLLLAAGGKDNKLCVWRVSDGRLLHTFITPSAIFSLIWIPDEEGVLVCGLEDGALSSILIQPARIQGHSFPRYHNFVVERLAVQGSRLASGALQELAIWRKGRHGEWSHDFDLGLPPKNSENQDHEVIVTSIHWTRSRSYSSVLLVTYMYHGYLIYNTHDWSLLFNVPLNGRIGDASVSLDGSKLVVSNMRSGFDIYAVETGQSIATLSHTVNRVRAVPVRFIHGGHAIMGGSTVGHVNLWDIATLRQYQPLVVEDGCEILTIDAHYDPVRVRFLIATGITNQYQGLPIVIWSAGVRAEEPAGWTARAFRVLPWHECRIFFWYLLWGLAGGLIAMAAAIFIVLPARNRSPSNL